MAVFPVVTAFLLVSISREHAMVSGKQLCSLGTEVPDFLLVVGKRRNTETGQKKFG